MVLIMILTILLHLAGFDCQPGAPAGLQSPKAKQKAAMTIAMGCSGSADPAILLALHCRCCYVTSPTDLL